MQGRFWSDGQAWQKSRASLYKMKKKFSTKWKASKQPRKQRKYSANAPLHIKRKMLSVNLSKDLRKNCKRRNIVVRKGDVVKIMRGKYKKKQAKIIEVNTRFAKVYIEGIQVKKTDGSKANIPFRPSNLQIIELNTEDKKRMKKMNSKEENKTMKIENKKEILKDKNTEEKNKK